MSNYSQSPINRLSAAVSFIFRKGVCVEKVHTNNQINKINQFFFSINSFVRLYKNGPLCRTQKQRYSQFQGYKLVFLKDPLCSSSSLHWTIAHTELLLGSFCREFYLICICPSLELHIHFISF